VTLVDAVNLAGFSALRSKLSSVVVYRNGKRLLIPERDGKDTFDVGSAMSDGVVEENVVIRENDVVFVSRTFFAWVSDQVDEALQPVATFTRALSGVRNAATTASTPIGP